MQVIESAWIERSGHFFIHQPGMEVLQGLVAKDSSSKDLHPLLLRKVIAVELLHFVYLLNAHAQIVLDHQPS